MAEQEVDIKTTRRSAHEILEQVIKNGRDELDRSTRALAFSGVAGGLTMGLTGLSVAIVQSTLGEGKWQVSRDGGDFPKWTAGGKEIVFQAPPMGTSKMAVDAATNGDAFEPGIPKVLFRAPVDFGWDVSADGKRFMLSIPPMVQQSSQIPITVVLNWPALLKK